MESPHDPSTSLTRIFRYRLHPTYKQAIELEKQLSLQCELYNAALEERIGAWNWEGRRVSYVNQCKTLTGLKEVRPEVVVCGITLCRGTLKRLDRAFSDFFKRVKAGQNPGFPRFRSARRWDSLEWRDTESWKLTKDHRLKLQGIGEIKLNYYRPHQGTPKVITVKREGTKWWLSLWCVDVISSPLPKTGKEIGIDLGVVNIVTTSEGLLLPGNYFEAKSRENLANAQRSLQCKQHGSNRRKRKVEEVGRIYRKAANRRKDAAHKLSRQLVNDFDFIAHEDLSITKMVSTYKTNLNRSIHDAGWGNLVSMISYKAECAGRTVVSVDPHYTSQRCSQCGHIESANRVNQAAFKCRSCGHKDNADVNAARNILWAGRAQLALASVG